MQLLLTCIRDFHDGTLLAAAGLICLVGVYGAFALSQHAVRSTGPQRRRWAGVSMAAAAATAWATHMIGLLAFHPGLQFAFDPVLMVFSLLAALGGIVAGMAFSFGHRGVSRRFASGAIIGCGIAVLHYLGQASYLVRGQVSYDWVLVVTSVVASIGVFGLALVTGGIRPKGWRVAAAPLLLLGIAILHFSGMTAFSISPDPRVQFPAYALPAPIVAPIVAAVSLALVALALVGLRFAIVAAQQVRRDARRLGELANLAVEGLVVCEGPTIRSINSSLQALSGFSKEALIGQPIALLLPHLAVDALPLREEQEAQLRRHDRTQVPVRVLRSQVQLGAQTQTIIAVRDQRERLQTEARIRSLAFNDTLTGLPNRLSVNERLDAMAAGARENGQQFAVLLLDLDRFKWVNDTLGHSVGDALLRQVAARLQGAGGSGTFVGRLGGDEFAVLLEGGAGPAGAVAQALVSQVNQPYAVHGHTIEVGASVGVALAPTDGTTSETLSRNADLALYRAKEDGGASVRFFAPAMHEKAQARRTMEVDLRHALLVEQFAVHYQPQIDPVSGAVLGAEALIRWPHPMRGMVPPDQFIPLAEEVGLIGAIGEWVLREACTEAAQWPDAISIAVNLSPLQLRDRRLARTVAAVLAATGLRPGRLELEVTETALVADDEVTYGNLKALQASGIRIAMDDFGTGYSSLSYLRRFPFDKLKIDKSFVQQIPHDGDSVAIVQAIATLAGKLGMAVTVEGVETAAQRSFAVDQGCEQIQGFLLGRPVAAAAMRAMLAPAAPRLRA